MLGDASQIKFMQRKPAWENVWSYLASATVLFHNQIPGMLVRNAMFCLLNIGISPKSLV